MRLLILAALALAACRRKEEPPADNVPAQVADPTAADIDSADILARTRTARGVSVKHILLAWKELEPVYQARKQPLDDRAKARSNADAAKLAQDLAGKLRADPQLIHTLAKQFSEDQYMSMLSDPYTLDAGSPFEPQFKKLALRLERGETGIVRTDFGYHVITRIAPVRDPIESREVLERKDTADEAWVQSILIGWKDTQAVRQGRMPDPRARDRTREDAGKMAADVLAKVATTDMAKLMAEYSEDPGSRFTGVPYQVTPESDMVENLVDLSLRLGLDEAGIVVSPLGWHVVKRIAQPPADPLESVDILARPQAAAQVKVLELLVGWSGAYFAADPRGKDRTHEQLTALVAKIRERAAKGEPFEALVKELSEHPSGKAARPNTYSLTASGVPRLRRLAVRLAVGEIGLVKTQYGIHILKRIE
ncbi:MAG: peptidylprolyl isomerase [Deltaproteobacteria bacterium]|nr:peptidylprolyl isomerase [Deltaproteobacteria bacterium]